MAKGKRVVGYVKGDTSEKVERFVEKKKRTGYNHYSSSRVIGQALDFFFKHHPIEPTT
jgi:hypothetical protein